MWPQGGPMQGPSPIHSPSYPMPHQQYPQGYGGSMMSPVMPGYPMDPSGARPAFSEGMGYEQNPMFYQSNPAAAQHQMMVMQHQQQMRQHQQRVMRARAAAAAAANAQMVPGMTGGPQGMQQGLPAPPHYDPNMYPGGVPMATNRVPGQVRSMMPYPQTNNMAIHQGLPSPVYPSPSAAGTQMIRAGPPMLYSQVQQTGGPQQVLAYPNPNVPPDQTKEQNPLMTIAKEVLLRPFALEHNVPTSTFNFTMSQEMFQQLQSRPDIEVQLKCFHKEDKKLSAQWPARPDMELEANVQVRVNGQIIPIKNLKKSLFVKQNVILGTNSVEFTVSHCVCSHSFIIQLVSRQPMSSIVNEIFTNNQMNNVSMETCREKMKLMAAQTLSGLRIPLVDENMRRKMRIPARSAKCAHAICFDLEPFLAKNHDSSIFECPTCSTVFSMAEIEVDHFIGNILRETAVRANIYEIIVESSGTWRPVELETRKRTAPEVDQPNLAGAIKRIKSEPFGNTIKSEPGGSPFPAGPTSVPIPFAQSPGPALMSPYNMQSTSSPTKMPASSPASARYLGGPNTPATPSQLIGNPSSVGVPPVTSPHHTQHQSHGSVEAASVAGSAPYTPASSVGSSTNHVTSSTEAQPFGNILNTSNVSIDFDLLDGGLITTTVWSAADLQKYLRDTDFGFDDSKLSKEDTTMAQLNDSWNDVAQIISADSH